MTGRAVASLGPSIHSGVGAGEGAGEGEGEGIDTGIGALLTGGVILYTCCIS